MPCGINEKPKKGRPEKVGECSTKNDMVYVLRVEDVSRASVGYSLLNLDDKRKFIEKIEPQKTVLDLVTLIRHDYVGPAHFSFDRPLDSPELSTRLGYNDGRCVRYSSLSEEERRKFVAHMSGYSNYGTEEWNRFMRGE